MISCVGFDGGAFAQYHTEARGDRMIRAYVKLVFSGSYVAGGDALDLTNGGGSVAAPNTIPPACTSLIDIDVITRSPAGGLANAEGSYVIVPPNSNAPLKFADLANLKLKIFSATNTEFSGAYGTSVLNDVVILECVYAR